MTNRINTALGLTLVLSLFVMGTALAEDAWYPSRYGAGDEIGAANLLSPALVREAAKLVRTGKTYALGIESNSDMPAYAPRSFKIIIVQPDQQGGGTLGPDKMTYNDDILEVGWGSAARSMGWVIWASITFIITLPRQGFCQADRAHQAGGRKNTADCHPRRADRHGRPFWKGAA